MSAAVLPHTSSTPCEACASHMAALCDIAVDPGDRELAPPALFASRA